MVLDGAITASDLLRFLARLVRDADGKVFLILDCLAVHRSARVRAGLAGREAAIETFYLPGYSPELNPDEGINADLKQAVTRKQPARTKAQVKRALLGHMRGASMAASWSRASRSSPLATSTARCSTSRCIRPTPTTGQVSYRHWHDWPRSASRGIRSATAASRAPPSPPRLSMISMSRSRQAAHRTAASCRAESGGRWSGCSPG